MAPLTRIIVWQHMFRHTISVPTNEWAIYGWATGRANDGDTGDIGAGHEVCIRTLSIVMYKGPKSLEF